MCGPLRNWLACCQSANRMSVSTRRLFRGRCNAAHRGFMAKANQVSIPYVDPTVQHVGISRLRALNVTQLRELDKTLVIQDNDEPLAVLLKYEHFLAMQERLGDE